MTLTTAQSNLQAADPSLDSLETSAAPGLPTCYEDYKFKQHRDELAAAIQLYGALDTIEGKERLRNLIECRHFAWFAWHEERHEVKVIANACKLRWCPVCAEARQQHIRAQVTAWIKTVRRPRLLTLTLSHYSAPLKEQIGKLYRSFRLLRQHRAIATLIRGGVWFFQIKRSNKDNCWHPHLHILLDSNYINQKDMSQEWLKTTGNSYIIDIRAIKDPGKVVNYVARYCARPCQLSDYEEADRIEIATVLFGKRICGSFGTGAKCRFAARPPEDAAMWKRIGNWRDIISNRYNVPEFDEVVKSFCTGRCLERSIFESAVRESYGPELPPFTITIKKEARQLCFDEFVHR